MSETANTRKSAPWLNRTVLEHHGMTFGVLATVNGIGDFLSSLVVGVLWSAFGPAVVFSYSAVLFTLGAVLVVRLR